MARKLLYATMVAWLMLFGARAGAQQTAPATAQEAAPATAQQPTSETPGQPVEQEPIVPATSNPTPPGSLQAAPDQAGTILPGFGFPYGRGANLTGTGITPFSLGGLVTGTGILPYQQAAGPSPTLFQVNQNVRFNDNVQFVPQGGRTPLGLQKGDWSETTVATVSPSMYISEQILFAHATYGFNRYRQDVGLDSNFWNADAGLKWKFGHLCTGTGLAAISQNLVPFQELTAFALETVTAQSVTETANCKLTDRVSGIIEGSYRTSEISGVNNQIGNAGSANNYKEQQIRAGLEYALPGLDTVRPQATFTAREFGNRPAGITTITGLASITDLELYELVYHRDLSPKLKFDGNLGFNQITTTSPTTISPGSSSTNSTGWSYSAALLYRATPKLTFQATSAQGVGPPLAVLSNFQATRFHTLSMYYRYSAKLTFTAAFSQGTTLNATSNFSSFSGTGASGTGVNPVAGVIQTRSVLIGAQYRASPFLSAFATYSYLDSKNAQLSQTTLQNVYLVGLTWQH